MEIYRSCKQQHLDICGFIEKAVFENDQRIGYDFVDPETGETCMVARKKSISECDVNPANLRQLGYRFFDEAWAWAESRIRLSQSHNILLIDELGRLEAQNLGLMPALSTSLHDYPRHLFAAVRGDALDRIESHLGKFDSIIRI